MSVYSTKPDAQRASETPFVPQVTMTVYLLHKSDMNCLLVTNEQLVAIVDLLDVELDLVSA